MRKLIALVIINVFLLGGLAFAVDFYVDASTTEGNVVGDGTSSNPWQTITYAFTQTSTGTVYVAAGTYEASMSGSSESFPISVPAGVNLKSAASPTTLATIAAGSEIRVITLNSSSTLDGFTITNSGVNSSNGAVYLASQAYVLNNIINCGVASARGVYAPDAADSSLINNNEISMTGDGRAIYLDSSCEDVTINGNTLEVGASGYGIYLRFVNGGYTITDNLIKGAGSGSGRGMYSFRSGAGTISTNEVRGFQYGIYWELNGYGVAATVSHNTIVNNTTGMILFSWQGTHTYYTKNNIVCANPNLGSFTASTYGIDGTNAGTSYNCAWNNATDYDFTPDSTDLTVYPRFISPESNDFRIGTDSPCATGGESGTYMGRYAPSGTSNVTSEVWVDDDTGSDSNPGTQASPLKTIKTGVTKGVDIIHVEAGTYDSGNGETFAITLAEDQHLKSEASPSNLAIIETSEARVVSLGLYSTVEGFTIKTSGSNSSYGALYLLATAEVLSNTVTCSSTSANLRAVYVLDAADGSLIKNNDIWVAGAGKAIYLDSSCSDVTINGNTLEVGASGYGIDLNFVNAGYTITDNLIKGAGSGTGYGMDSFRSGDGTISTNEVRGFQYGIYWELNGYGETGYVYNNTVVNNTTGMILFSWNGTHTYYTKNNIVCGDPELGSFTTSTYGIDGTNAGTSYNSSWNNATNFDFSSGTGDITVYPRFISPESNDYSIGTDSPCATSGEAGTYMGRYAPSGTSNVTSEVWVDDTGSDSNPGTQASPFKTINRGITMAADVIHVEAGTYDSGNGETFAITLAEDQHLKSEASPSNLAIIDASSDVRVVGLGPYSTVEGFTIKTAGTNSSNGAIYLLATAEVLSNTITCSASSARGVFAAGLADSSLINNNDIWMAGDGRGVYLDSSCDNVTMEGNTIEVGASGYGIHLNFWNTGYTITNNLIKGAGSGRGINQGGRHGNGTISTNEVRSFEYGMYLYLEGSSNTANIYKNTVVKNKYGITCTNQSGSPTFNITDNIIASEVGGYSVTGSKGIDRNGGTVNSTYNDLYANDTTYEGTVSDQTGDKEKNPRFVDATNNDFNLLFNSPCIISASDGTDRGRYPFTGTIGVYVETPDGGETLTGYSSYTITWTATKPAGGALTIDLAYSIDSGSTYTDIATGETNDGSYSWPVVNITTTTDAKVRVIANGSIATDESDSNFTIQAGTLTVTVETPNGGETWEAGTYNNITWETNVTCDSINLYYSTDSGSSYTLIATGETDDSSYSWLVPDVTTTSAKVKIEGLKDSDIATDESDATFAITSASDYYVNVSNGSNSYNGLTSEVSGSNGPWKNISYAATQAASGQTIRVTGAGTYSAAAGESFPISVPASVNVISNVSPSNLATVDAGSEIRVFTLNSSSSLDGFTIKNSGANSSNGAVYPAGSAYIFNNIITCSASSVRAIYVPDGADGSQIKGNNIWVGSSSRAIYVHTLVDNMIVNGNTIEAGSSSYGILFYAANDNFSITNNLVKGTSGTGGIGNYFALGGGSIYSGTIASNEVRGFTYGISARPNSGKTVNAYHNTLVNNTQGVLAPAGGSTFNVTNNIICADPALGTFTSGTYGIVSYNSSITSTYNDIWNVGDVYGGTGSVSGQTGDITSYPRFITTEALYKIGTDSPCATGGENSTYMGRYGPSGTSGITTESWIDDGGDDATGDGSNSTPWQTIGYALGKTEGTVHLKAGTYNAANGDSFPYTLAEDQKIDSVASPTTAATIDAESTARVFNLGPYATIEGVTIKTAGSDLSYGAIHFLDTGYLLSSVVTCSSTSSNVRAIYVSDTGDYSQVKDSDIWAGAGGGRGIYLEYVSAGVDNVTIEGNTIEVGASGYGIYFDVVVDGFMVTDNLIKGAGTGVGIYHSNGGYSDNGTISTNEVRNFADGIYVKPGGGFTVYAYNNTVVDFTGTGIYCQGTGTHNVTNNIVSAVPQLGTFETGTYGVRRSAGTANSTYNSSWNNAINYSGVSDATGDITSFPRFITSEGVYKIGTDSPCASAGEGGTYMGRYSPSGTSSISSESWVDDDGGSDANVGSAAFPWEHIYYALDRTDGTVHLKAGTYDTSANGESFPYTLAEDQQIDSVASPTTDAIIDAENIARALSMGPDTTIEGCTIKTAAANSSDGALYLMATAEVLSNTITCSASAANAVYGSGTADGSQVRDNDIWVAGSAYAIYLAANCNNVTIDGNTMEVGASGFGVYFYPVVDGFTVSDNLIKGAGSGYGISNGTGGYSDSGIVCTNEVRGFEYGLRLKPGPSGDTVNVYKNTVVKNTYGILCEGLGTHTLTNNIIASEIGGYSVVGSIGIDQNAGTVNSTYNDIYANDSTYEGTVSLKTQDIEITPECVDATNDDYHLNYNSHCIASASDGTDRGRYPFTGTIGVYVVSPESGESLTGLASYTITWVATKPAGGALTIDLAYSIDSGNSYTQFVSGETNDGSYNWTVANVQTTEAKIQVTANGSIATDESDSNFSISSIDATPPTVTVEAPAGGEKWQGGSTQSITFSVTDESGILANSLSIWYSTDQGVTYGNVITSGASVSSPYSWTVPSINTNEARVRVTVQDNSAQQNAGTGESISNFTIDSTNPSAPTLTAPANASATNDATTTFIWTAATDNLSSIASYEIKIDTKLVTQGATTTYTTSAALSEGVHTWEVKAKDGAGNWGSYSSSFTFEVDTVTPEAPTLITLPNASYTNDSTPTLTWEVSNLAEVLQFKISLSPPFPMDGITAYSTSPSYTTPTLVDGTTSWSVSTQDLASNWGPSSSTFSFEIDTGTPEAPTLVTPSNASVTSDNTPLFTWEAATDAETGIASYEIRIDTTPATQGATTTYTSGILSEALPYLGGFKFSRGFTI